MPDLARRSLLTLPLLSWPALARADAFPLGELMARLAAVPERRASFRESRRFAALSEVLQSAGHLLYRRPGYLEKVTDWPQPERLVVDGRWLTLTEGSDPPHVVDLGGQPELRTMIEALRAPLAGDLPQLQRSFAVEAAGDLAAWSLALEPRARRATELLRSVRVEGRGDAITAIRLVQSNGDEQWMQIGVSG